MRRSPQAGARPPEGLERGQELVRGVFLGLTAHEGRGHRAAGPPRPDGGRAMGAEKFDPFVDDFGFVFLAGAGVTIPLLGQHCLSCDFAPVSVPASVPPNLS